MMTRKVLLIIIAIIPFFLCTAKKPAVNTIVKNSSIAGRWYPADKNELSGQIDELLKNATAGKSCNNPFLLILPHAGYQYSGQTAAAGYRMLGTTGKPSVDPDLIIILGPSHYEHFRGCAVLPADYIETPLGQLKVDRKISQSLLSDSLFKENSDAFEKEHSIEIHLPFIQRIFGDTIQHKIQILPLLAGDLTDDEAARIAAKIASATSGKRALFIVSTDFTHYGPDFGYVPFKCTGKSTADKLKGLDNGAVNHILKKDLKGFSDYAGKTGITICGRNPVKIALSLPVNNFKAQRISYDVSGNMTGDYTNSVSYVSILFCGKLTGSNTASADSDFLSLSDKKFLVKIARENISSWLKTGKGIAVPADVPKNCMLKRGSFVTLRIGSDLRGCVGYIGNDMPLVQTVLDSSYNAAFRDGRFMPLVQEEFGKIKLEISVLTEPVPVKSVDEIVTGRDGLIMQKGIYKGLLLPQVPGEYGWDRDTFLSRTCLKAGLAEDCWKDKKTEILKFQAIVFDEDEL